MKRFINYYLKFFWDSFLGLLLLFLILAHTNTIKSAFLNSLFLSAGVTLFLAFVHFILLKNRKIHLERFETYLSSSAQIFVNKNIIEIRTIIVSDLSKHLKSIVIKEVGNYFELETNATMSSFGENISLYLEAISDKETKLLVSSTPTFKGTLIDYGKNKKNIKGIQKYFSEDMRYVTDNLQAMQI